MVHVTCHGTIPATGKYKNLLRGFFVVDVFDSK